MVRRAGIPGLAHVINAVALISVVSVANANLYVTVRSLSLSSANLIRVEVCLLLQKRRKLQRFS